MTDMLAGGVPLETGFANHMIEAERQVRSFLMTATRYLAPGRNVSAFANLEAAALDTRSMSAAEFDRTLIRVCKNPGK
ncbi:MAG: hypothetical protein KDK07_15290 [Bauldia sp.]|nr:hypothetical protein [Bauldia sp.]